MPSLITRPLFTDVPGPLPYTYVVPGSLELVVQSIVARFDGSGAGGAFLPCISIYTQDGHLLARVRPDQEFAAGDTGVVTFAPFLRRKAASTPPPPVGTTIYWLEATDTLVTSGAGLTQFDWSATGPFNDGTFFDLDGSGELEILGAGIYAYQVVVGGLSLTSGVSTTLNIQIDVTAGSQGQWSSKYVGVGSEGFAAWGERFSPGGTNLKIDAFGQSELAGFAGWASTATFPVGIRVSADVQEDFVSVAKTVKARLSVIRLGTGFE